jgi:hypothetical protein
MQKFWSLLLSSFAAFVIVALAVPATVRLAPISLRGTLSPLMAAS